MSGKVIYDEYAASYDCADQFGAIHKSHAIALEQVSALNLKQRSKCKVLDLGVGDGAFLKKLTNILSNTELTGFDISAEMIKRAQAILPIHAIEASALDALQYIPSHSQDLVLAHFINAYIPTAQLFKVAHQLTRSTGYFSMITTTYDSFPMAQQHLADCIAEGSLLSNVVGHYYKSIVKQTTVAASQTELLASFPEHGFEVVDHQRLTISIDLPDVEALASFGIDGAWFLNSLSIRILPRQFLINRLKRIFSKIFTFPYKDKHHVDVVLARPNTEQKIETEVLDASTYSYASRKSKNRT